MEPGVAPQIVAPTHFVAGDDLCRIMQTHARHSSTICAATQHRIYHLAFHIIFHILL